MGFLKMYWKVVLYHLAKWPTRRLRKRPHVCSEMPEWSLTCLDTLQAHANLSSYHLGYFSLFTNLYAHIEHWLLDLFFTLEPVYIPAAVP